jgi:hypothetical protein
LQKQIKIKIKIKIKMNTGYHIIEHAELHFITFPLLLFVISCLPAAHANTPPAVPTGMQVELLNDAYSINTNNPSFSWMTQDHDNGQTQSAYRIVFSGTLSGAAAGNYFLDTGWLTSANCTAVKVDGLSALLEPNSLYYWQVQTRDKSGAETSLSAPKPFTTAVQWANTGGIWLEPGLINYEDPDSGQGVGGSSYDEKTNFIFLRHAFEIEDISTIEKAILAATAFNTESSRQYVFELFLNGQSIGVGPARNQNNTPAGHLQYYNSYDVTGLLKNGDNIIASINYNKDAARSFLLQMTLYYADGSTEILINSARDAAKWKGKDGTLAFGQNDEYTSPDGWYHQHKEHIDAEKYPFGFARAGFIEDNTWRAVKPVNSVNGSRTLLPYTSENSLRYLMPASKVTRLANGNYVVTLEKEIVGSLQLDINTPTRKTIEIHLGEELNTDGSVRNEGRGHPNYIEYWTLKPGEQSIQSLNMKNFRYVEIIGAPTEITTENIKGYAVRQPFDEEAADFNSSNNFLNELYTFTKYSIQATNQDVWTDSNARERGPYEGDAIINMVSSNTFSANYSLGRHSHEYLINNQTWPQEYKLFSVEMAWIDYLYTGDHNSINKYYTKLKNKFPGTFDANTGLVSTTYTGSSDRVLIDWPESERDNYHLQAYTAGYNALYASACRAMANIAATIGNETDRLFYQTRADTIKKAMINKLYNPQKGAFDDSMSENGELSGHYSQHATAYALACRIFDTWEMADKLADYIKNQGGFKTSIYAAFFVLQGLYNAGADDVAMEWMADENPDHVRTWAHVLRQLNATISPEAWDPDNKRNMTFSHPWGTAPASAISRGMFGIQPIDPAFKTFQIKIQPGSVQNARIKLPTIRGRIEAAYNLGNGENAITAEVKIPPGTRARVSLPVDNKDYAKLIVNGETLLAERDGKFLTLTLEAGAHTLSISDETLPYIELTVSAGNDGILRLGKTGKVTVTALNEQKEPIDLSEAVVTCTSSDESIITISSSDTITALKVGKTTITVTVKCGNLEGLVSLPVRVTGQPFPGDDKIQTVELRLDASTTGEIATPSMIGILGDGSEIAFSNVTYTSGNENIAAVNADATLSLLAEGEFTLKAATTDHFEKLAPDFDFSRFEITPLYTGDFNNTGNPFTGVTTNMAVRDGRLFVGKSSNAIYAGGTEWTDYILLATVNTVPGSGTTVAPGGPAATFHFRANSGRTQLYMWQLFNGNYLKKHVNITETGSLVTAIDGMKPAGQDNRVAVAAEGSRIMTYVNGKLADVAEYANYFKGTIGLRTGSSEEFYVDNLVVGTRKLVATLNTTIHSKTANTQAASAPPASIIAGKGKIQAAFEGKASIKLYSVTGLLMDETVANNAYTRNMEQGIYILSLNDKSYKIIVK